MPAAALASIDAYDGTIVWLNIYPRDVQQPNQVLGWNPRPRNFATAPKPWTFNPVMVASGKVFVLGNVRRPGAYRLDMGQRGSVLSIIALAEGLSPYSRDVAYVFRHKGDGARIELPIPINRIMDRKAPDFELQADDIFYIPDNRMRKATLSILEKAASFGTGATTALIYGAAR